MKRDLLLKDPKAQGGRWPLKALFLAALAVAVLLTIGGARELINQVTAVPAGKSGAITIVVDFGLALIGPVLFVALIILAPRSWIPRIIERIREALVGPALHPPFGHDHKGQWHAKPHA